MTLWMRILVYFILLPALSLAFHGKLFVFKTRESFFRQTLDDNDIVKTQQQTKEMLLEELSMSGAGKIAILSIPERAKRALLAEAIEDRIIRLTEEVDQMIGVDGGLSQDLREKVIEAATRMKDLQIQYDELVSGKPSSVLTVLDALGEELKNK